MLVWFRRNRKASSVPTNSNTVRTRRGCNQGSTIHVNSDRRKTTPCLLLALRSWLSSKSHQYLNRSFFYLLGLGPLFSAFSEAVTVRG